MVKKLKIYFDTSVPSSYYDATAPEQTKLTKLFWQKYLKKYQPFISEATIAEIERTKDLIKHENILKLVKNFHLLKIDKDVQKIATSYLDSEIIPKNYPIDALHIACATVNKIYFLITWNITHMANPNRRKALTEFNAKNNLFIPQLTTPQELIQTYEKNI
ncbi:MAG TPA: PIN domain-containing protein [bacterium]|nr:PIN domain-containing protein [bacterium]